MLRLLLGVLALSALATAPAGGSGASLAQAPMFAGELFGPGQLLDAGRYDLILPDDIGHGAHTWAINWKDRLAELLRESAK
ncbi:MAG TPA: hypothetical protein VME40_17030 [Caulobacteraceae bacterium]|nr:hypothetical protein [Caulobacteraceae bacterium]